MTAQTATEALLYLNPGIESKLRAVHVLSKDRPWTAKAHPEYAYMKYFHNPKILEIISKQIHIYIIGDLDYKNGNRFHIINLEGFHADHMILTKKELTELIKETVKTPLFLPNNFYDRIIYINGESLFIFNRVSALQSNMFSNKSKWTIGADVIYDAEYELSIKEKNTNATEILNEIYEDCFRESD